MEIPELLTPDPHRDNDEKMDTSGSDIENVFMSVKSEAPLVQSSDIGTSGESGSKKRFPCDKCGRTFILKTSLKSHLLDHGSSKGDFNIFGIRPDTNVQSSKPKVNHSSIFGISEKPTKSNVGIVNSKKNEKPVNKTNNRNSNLTSSRPVKRKLVGFSSNGEWFCQLCDDKFDSRVGLMTHLRTHKKKDQFKCLICDKGFVKQKDFIKHQLLHKKAQLNQKGRKSVTRVDGEYSCDLCDKTYTLKRSFNKHMARHRMRERFKCTECGDGFCSQKALDNHNARHRTGDHLLCLVCNDHFPYLKDLRKHLRTHKEDGSRFCCSECKLLFRTHDAIFNHLRSIHSFPNPRTKVTMEQPENSCVLCDDVFQTEIEFKEHLAMHERDLTCLRCARSFDSVKAIRSHIKTHKDNVRVACSICRKVISKNTLTSHMRIHTGEKPYHCEICGKGFKQTTHLHRHKVVHMDKKSRKIALMKFSDHNKVKLCEVCGKSYKGNLKLHSKTHFSKDHPEGETVERSYKCTVCLEELSSQSELNKHKMLHHPETLPACQLCSQRFNFRQGLYTHYLKHSPEEQATLDPELQNTLKKLAESKPHRCTYCDKTFKLKHCLVYHVRTHTGERPFACTICPKRFIQQAHWKSHMALHTNTKPHICSICGKGFAVQSYLYNHVKKTHAKMDTHSPRTKTLVFCPHCGKDFASQRGLQHHQKNCMSAVQEAHQSINHHVHQSINHHAPYLLQNHYWR